MISAKEAKEAVDKCQGQKVQDQLKSVEQHIKIAIDKGDYSCNMDFIPYPIVKAKLEELGYKVECSTFRNETNTLINWRD